jgi:hypothetical protein
MMTVVLAGTEKFTEPYIDDVATHSSSWPAHVTHLTATLEAFHKAGMTIKLKKCTFASPSVEFVGHVVGSGTIAVIQSKVDAIASMAEPVNKKQLKSFLAMCSYYRSFTGNMAKVAVPLTEMTKNRCPKNFVLNSLQRHSFQTLKDKLSSSEVLHSPRYDRHFIISTDASEYAIGACLSQLNDDGIECPISFVSNKLTDTQCRWAVVEKEAYAIVYALEKFSTIVFNCRIVVYTDHNPLQYLTRCAPSSAKLMRWALHLNKYDLEVKYRPGILNGNADCMSRLVQ